MSVYSNFSLRLFRSSVRRWFIKSGMALNTGLYIPGRVYIVMTKPTPVDTPDFSILNMQEYSSSFMKH